MIEGAIKILNLIKGNNMKTKILAILLTAIVLGWLIAGAEAQVSATQENNLTVIWKNKCPDLPPEAFLPVATEAEWEARHQLWLCHNQSQGAQTYETLRQIKLAIKNTGFKKKVTVYSIDPYCTKDYCDYGAKVKKGKLYYAADVNGCAPARRTLERELRKLK